MLKRKHKKKKKTRNLWKPATAAMQGPHNVLEIGNCTVIHCGAGGVSLVDL